MPPSPSAQPAVQKLFASCADPWDARACQSSEEMWADPPEGSTAHLLQAISEHFILGNRAISSILLPSWLCLRHQQGAESKYECINDPWSGVKPLAGRALHRVGRCIFINFRVQVKKKKSYMPWSCSRAVASPCDRQCPCDVLGDTRTVTPLVSSSCTEAAISYSR